jgi:small basic protein (TIGR04137 family)
MSIDKSLKRKNTLARSRNVLNRAERIAVLKSEDRWVEGMGPFNLPKVRILKVGKKVKKPSKETAAAAAGAAPAAAGDKKAAAGDKKAAPEKKADKK